MEKEHKKDNEIRGLGPQLITVDDYDSTKEEIAKASMSAEMLTTTIFKRKPYTCPTYRSAR